MFGRQCETRRQGGDQNCMTLGVFELTQGAKTSSSSIVDLRHRHLPPPNIRANVRRFA